MGKIIKKAVRRIKRPRLPVAELTARELNAERKRIITKIRFGRAKGLELVRLQERLRAIDDKLGV